MKKMNKLVNKMNEYGFREHLIEKTEEDGVDEGGKPEVKVIHKTMDNKSFVEWLEENT